MDQEENQVLPLRWQFFSLSLPFNVNCNLAGGVRSYYVQTNPKLSRFVCVVPWIRPFLCLVALAEVWQIFHTGWNEELLERNCDGQQA